MLKKVSLTIFNMANGPELKKEKDKPKKLKKKTNAKLKKELDKIFSLYIRRKYADKNGEASCYTCGKIYKWQELQCGHFVSRQHLATRYDERNVRPQDIGCNIFGGGRVATFATKLESEQKGMVTTLYRKAQEITKDFPYQAMIEEYKKKLLTLQK